MKQDYFLLDPRAAGNLEDIADLDNCTILLIGSAREVCEAANAGEYGEGCLVAKPNGKIMWGWLGNKLSKWLPEE